MLLSIPPRPSSRPRLIPGLSLRSGDLIAGRYRALSLLRADRACAHFAAIDSVSHARVEVQILLAMDDAIEPVMLRFLADARKAATLREPHVERILHVGVTDDGHPFIVREPSSGETLASVLGKWGGSLPTEVSVDIAIAICEALESAHAVGLVHGELDATTVRLAYGANGPSNVKVTGLGTSRALAMLPFDRCSLASVALRAPEVIVADSEVDARVDVWSAGVLLYTMLAGAAPFASDSPSTLDVTAYDEPALLAGVPDGLAEVVDGCLSRDPALRPQTAASLAARLALYGSRPVFEKRGSLLVVDTGRYEAQVLEQLVKDAGPSAPSIDVEMDAPSSPSLGDADMTPEPSVVTRSAPPVAMTVAPPVPVLAPKAASPAPPSRRGRTFAFAAAACIGIGAIALALATRGSSPSSSPAALAAEPPPAAKNDPLPVQAQPQPQAPAAARPPSAEPRALAISDLPSAPPATQPKPLAPSAKLRATAPAKGAAAPAAEAAPAVDPIVRSASAPIQPQPKASDDDLRRFLDDRR